MLVVLDTVVIVVIIVAVIIVAYQPLSFSQLPPQLQSQ